MLDAMGDTRTVLGPACSEGAHKDKLLQEGGKDVGRRPLRLAPETSPLQLPLLLPLTLLQKPLAPLEPS